MSHSPIEEIKVTHEPPPMEGERLDHPAFAVISAHRITGGTTLYGSDFNHHNFISIRVSASSLKRSLSHDWVSQGRDYIEVEVSEAQWAHFVSSFNCGTSTQCTLRRLHGENVPRLPPPQSRKDKFKKEALETAEEALMRLDALSKMIEEMTASQKSKNELLKQAQSIKQSLNSSLPFVLSSFGKHMETTVEKAKVEINAYTTNAVMRAGLDALHGQQILSTSIKNNEHHITTLIEGMKNG